MRAAHQLLLLGKRRTLEQRVLSALRRYNGSQFVPAIGSNVWSTTTGTTLSTLDGTVAAMLDTATSIGPELVTDEGSNTAKWTATSGATVSSPEPGTIRLTAGATGLRLCSFLIPGIYGAGKTFLISADVRSVGGDSVLVHTISTALSGTYATAPTSAVITTSTWTPVSIFLTTSDSAEYFGMRILSATAADKACEMRNISVTEVGLLSTQATAGYQPPVRKGDVNLLTYSEDFSNAAWTKTSCAYSSNTVTESASNAVLIRTASTSIGATPASAMVEVERGNTDWIRFIVANESSVTNQSRVWINLATGALGTASNTGSGITIGTPTIKNIGSGKYMVVLPFTNTAGNAFVALISAAGDTSTTRADVGSGAGVGATYKIYKSMLVQGTYTASNFPTYVTTTTAPKSNEVGYTWLNFDGVDDALTVPAAQLSGYTSSTLVYAQKGVGHTTLSGQNYTVSGLTLNATRLVGAWLFKTAPSATDLALIEQYADKLAGV